MSDPESARHGNALPSQCVEHISFFAPCCRSYCCSLNPCLHHNALRRLGEAAVLDCSTSGFYQLDLGRPVERALAGRLQGTALQECAAGLSPGPSACWRNAMLDGQAVPTPVLDQLQRYELPHSGLLTLDFVSYQASAGGNDPAAPARYVLCLQLRTAG